jgi:hypothetical protein
MRRPTSPTGSEQAEGGPYKSQNALFAAEHRRNRNSGGERARGALALC